jgi:hypothetical protein
MKVTTYKPWSFANLWMRFRLWLAAVHMGRPPFNVISTFEIELDNESIDDTRMD